MDPEDSERSARGRGDVGRRIAHRRTELGLTRSAVAKRAGIAADYHEYVEDSPAQPSVNVLLRLAEALETTLTALLGATTDVPVGQGRAAPHARLEVLSGAEFSRLLGARGIGRLVVEGKRAPIAVPVNYVVFERDIVIRTEADNVLADAAGRYASFEVDNIDDALQQDWSVLVSGRLQVLHDSVVRARVAELELEPWAGGERPLELRLHTEEMTGRRIYTR